MRLLPLILGLAVFLGGHIFVTQRHRRAALITKKGESFYRLAFSIVAATGLALIAGGFARYRAGGYIQVWDPPRAMLHLNVLLNWISFVLLAAAYLPGRIKAAAKHPMLLAVKVWALGHLLANGDLGSILLFGSFLAWAVFARISLKSRDLAEPDKAFAPKPLNDVIAVAIGTAAYLVMLIWLHRPLFGVPAWPV